jgi:hypothetical protein
MFEPNPNVRLDQSIREAQSLDAASKVLLEILDGGYSIWEDGTLYNVRHLVDRIQSLKIHIYAGDHAPPHFHIAGPDIDAAFTIENCTLLKGRMKGKKQQLVRWWYERSRPLLVKTWNETRPGDSTVGPTK